MRGLRSSGVIAGVDLAAVGRQVQAMITVRQYSQTRVVMHGFGDFVLDSLIKREFADVRTRVVIGHRHNSVMTPR